MKIKLITYACFIHLHDLFICMMLYMCQRIYAWTPKRKHTKNRLKKTLFNHLSKSIHRKSEKLLPTSATEIDMLLDLEGASIIMKVLGIEKNDYQDYQDFHLLKDLPLKMINDQNNPNGVTHVLTDGGSSEGQGNRHLHQTNRKEGRPPRLCSKGSRKISQLTTKYCLLHRLQISAAWTSQHQPHTSFDSTPMSDDIDEKGRCSFKTGSGMKQFSQWEAKAIIRIQYRPSGKESWVEPVALTRFTGYRGIERQYSSIWGLTTAGYWTTSTDSRLLTLNRNADPQHILQYWSWWYTTSHLPRGYWTGAALG